MRLKGLCFCDQFHVSQLIFLKTRKILLHSDHYDSKVKSIKLQQMSFSLYLVEMVDFFVDRVIVLRPHALFYHLH